MNSIAAQVSLYPLRQQHLGTAISKALAVFTAHGLEVRPGSLSTVVVGGEEAVFESLKAAFRAGAASGDVVMVVTVSNACPEK
ncbi:MAG: hypothetical protein JNM18_22540 [Planctomycetaceae bacterium]|nr:hypothetical protein [Planctomycetaceae bacterium]